MPQISLTQIIFPSLHIKKKSPFWVASHTISENFLTKHRPKPSTLFSVWHKSETELKWHYLAFVKGFTYFHISIKTRNFPNWLHQTKTILLSSGWQHIQIKICKLRKSKWRIKFLSKPLSLFYNFSEIKAPRKCHKWTLRITDIFINWQGEKKEK